MISIVIPMYNEKMRISSVLAELQDYLLRGKGYASKITEVVVVDDGSRDNSIETALYFQDKLPLTVVPMAQNSGKWAAIDEGIFRARNDWILIMDADGSAGISNIDKIPKSLLRAKNVAFFGSRFLPDSVVEGKTPIRIVVSEIYRLYARYLCRHVRGHAPDDLQAPFKLFRQSDLKVPLVARRFAGDLDLFCSLNVKILDVPLDFMHRPGSKVSISAVWDMVIESQRISRRYRKISRK